ncbi:MAG TPA: class I SAM-dependent methyltransferase [Planctomycetes bacterium]|nr:class I SAM-dependent methyltransferase [Planctomycetota bacterium]
MAKSKGLTAKTADRHFLYQAAVQDSESETERIIEIFKKIRRRSPMTLREDFCGTAIACASWVKSHRKRTAMGLDLDEDVLAWGRQHNLRPLGDDAKRVTLLTKNVISTTSPKVDLCTAFNFSYCIFKDRKDLIRYFKRVRSSLVDDGVFMMDLYGGTDAGEVLEEARKCKWKGKTFTYVWDQAYFNPIDNHVINHIHFRFPDKSEMKKAFTYDWRLWSPVEVSECLAEAGFTRSRVWWEEEDEDGDGTGVYHPVTEAENQAGWICYIVAER